MSLKNGISLIHLLILILLPHWAGAQISRANANWEIFLNRSVVQAIEFSKDGETLWIGTTGGLEQRDAETGKLGRVFTTLDGLPNNFIWSLANDGDGGVWIGTKDGGLAHLDSDNQWTIFNTENSKLPDDFVLALINDNNGGIWIGTNLGGFAHLNARSEWQLFNTDNSDLPNNYVRTLISDGQDGLWIGSNGLAHLDNQGSGSVFNTKNSDLPLNGILAITTDGNGGLWLGTFERNQDGSMKYGGLSHINDKGQGTVFNTDNSKLPHDGVVALADDGQGGVWIGTLDGLAHLSSREQWTIYTPQNSSLPHEIIFALQNDNQERLWIGTDNGLASYHNRQDEWQVFNDDNSDLPDNIVQTFVNDDQSGLWVGTHFGGLSYLNALSEWETFNSDNSDLPINDINTLLNDGNGGIWIGTYGGGLAQRRSNGQWKNFNLLNSDLPNNKINALMNDGSGGLWIAMDKGGGLAHLEANAEWTLFDTDNSSLPGNDVIALLSDNNGGLWLGTDEGLAHFDADTKWTVFNSSNSDLPVNKVFTIAHAENDGVWVGTHKGGLAQLDNKGRGTVFTTDNSELPDNTVIDLITDEQGGLWVGSYGGLTYISPTQKWTNFNAKNSGLPTDAILDLMDDGNNGLWIAQPWDGGMTHLTFGQPLNGQRAAILIHPNVRGGDEKHNLNASIMGHIYQALSERHYTHEEIYFLSYDLVDINKDRIRSADRNAIDALKDNAQMTLADIRQAFEWAEKQGKLTEPLLIAIVGEISDGQLLLNANTENALDTSDLKALLDDYQQATSNQVMIVLETSQGTQWISSLATDENRMIITSTSDEQTQHQKDYEAFSWHYFNALRRGSDFWTAFEETKTQTDSSQTPQFHDDNRRGRLAKKLCLNGCFAPKADRTTYNNEDQIRITLPDAGLLADQSKDLYVGIGMPDGATIFLLTELNEFIPFDGTTLPRWEGQENIVEYQVIPDLPRGQYQLYLLRVKKGVEPLAHPELWELNLGSVTIE